ncbi:MAG: hypothetical protein ACFFEF_01010 [Candidatus Thorarchaeota archaeon]
MKVIGIALIIGTLFLLPMTYVNATNTQGLEWGFNVGDKFHYTFTVAGTQISYEQGTKNIYIEVTSLPPIPDTVTSISNAILSTSYISGFYENGTPLGFTPYWIVMCPIGNWSLLTQLLEESAESATGDVTIVNNAGQWGYIYVEQFTGATKTTTLYVSKTNGVTEYYKVYMDYTSQADEYFELAVPGSLNLPLDSTTLLIIGVAAVVLVILVVVAIKRR